MSKIRARQCVFELVYEYLFSEKFNNITLDILFEEENLDEDNKLYITDSYKGIIQNYQKITNIIKNNLTRYKIEDLSKVDLAIIITAVYPICILNTPNIKLEINEAVDLAKKYSNDNSYKFVNGVLANIVKSRE